MNHAESLKNGSADGSVKIPNATVDIAGLSKWFGDVVAVTNVTFQIGPGVTGLLGPNGAGKSTLFKCMTGLSAPSTGSVRLLGRDAGREPDVFKETGICPDVDRFYEEMRGVEFITWLARLHGFDKKTARAAAERSIERVGMTEVMNKKFGAMSKGMRQRMKFAQSIVHDPRVLFLDEPLNGMDPLARHATVELIDKLGREGKTVVVSSHILHEVDAMANRILLLVNGRILAEGSVREIREAIRTRPHRVALTTRTPRPVAQQLLNVDGTLGIVFEAADRLLIDTSSPDVLLGWITNEAAEARIQVDELALTDENLESIFEMLVG
ncbi:MAG: ABC transporter ATP-binding protein [Planctomycetes bacterium]|nr:ABC transporter ATP-binding protein [Planctomycetota bacterium]